LPAFARLFALLHYFLIHFFLNSGKLGGVSSHSCCGKGKRSTHLALENVGVQCKHACKGRRGHHLGAP
jgi:hypothetical protein